MRPRVGIRVWLPLAFALVAAVTAFAVERGVSRGRPRSATVHRSSSPATHSNPPAGVEHGVTRVE
jgi:hypothetical protein